MTRYDGLVPDLDETLYHSLPGLSSTGVKKILKSPAHFQHYVNSPPETKDEFDLGSAAHAKILGVGADIAIYPDGPGESGYEWWPHEGTVLNIRGGLGTKLSAEFEQAARAQGLIPVKRVTARVVDKMVESFLANDLARSLISGGQPEVSMFTTDPDTGVALRGRVDYLGKRIADVKTTGTGASERDFTRHAFDLGYHIQAGHYSHIHELITGESKPWLFVVIESTAPYLTAVHMLSDEALDMGRAWARLARERYAECQASGRWPGYRHRDNRAYGTLDVPAWALVDYIDTFERSAA